MNISKYASIYSQFHGCFSFQVHGGDMIVLDFSDEKWETWLVTRLYQSRRIEIQVDHSLVKALKVLYKTEAPASVFCKQDSWSILLGSERMIIPSTPIVKHCSKEKKMLVESASPKIHLVATPFFVRDPQVVYEYLQGIARPSSNHIFSYQNAILYLDPIDIPRPGGCYFDKPENTNEALPLYRICILGHESVQHLLQMAQTWRSRRGVMHVPFQTQDTIAFPSQVSCKPISHLHFDPDTSLTTNTIHKQYSLNHPQCLVHDILNSYYRHLRRQYEDSDSDDDPRKYLQFLGLVMEWPLRITYEGLPRSGTDNQVFVSLAINGHVPNRVLKVCRPYERYVEYGDVPAAAWIPITYVPDVLETPADVVKVSIDSTVIGFHALGTFFCFGRALLEGNVSKVSLSNANEMFQVAKPETLMDNRVNIIDTFYYDSGHVLHRVAFKDINMDTYCLCTSTEDTSLYPKCTQLPWLVNEWLRFYAQEGKKNVKSPVNASLVRLALVLGLHKICYELVISNKPPKEEHEMVVNDKNIEIYTIREVADYINKARLSMDDISLDEKQEASCCIL